jgi:hypothetical protein
LIYILNTDNTVITYFNAICNTLSVSASDGNSGLKRFEMALNVIVTILYMIDIQVIEILKQLGDNIQLSYLIERLGSDSNKHELNALTKFQNS